MVRVSCCYRHCSHGQSHYYRHCSHGQSHYYRHCRHGQSQPLLRTFWSRSNRVCHYYVCLLVGCSTFQHHASVFQGRICSDNCTCCHTEIEVAKQTFHLTQSQYTNAGLTSPSTDPITLDAWQGSHCSANF